MKQKTMSEFCYEKINPLLPEIYGILRLLLCLSPYFLLKKKKDSCNDTSKLLLVPTVNDSLLETSWCGVLR